MNLIKMKAIEDVMYRNVRGINERCKVLEKQDQGLTEAIQMLLGHIHSLKGDLDEMRKQLTSLQQQFYAKGTVSYGDNSELANKRSIDPTD